MNRLHVRLRPAWVVIACLPACADDRAARDSTTDAPESATDTDDAEDADGSDGGADDAVDTGDPTPGTTSGATADDAADSSDGAGDESSGGEGTSGGAQGGSAFWVLDAVYAPDMTADGETVLMGDAPGSVFRWTELGGLEVVTSAQFGVVAISEDATRIAGTLEADDGTQVAAIWDEGIGWTELGDVGSCDSFRSSAYDISSDGNIVVGLGWEGCSGVGFWWEDGQAMTALPVLEQGDNRASALSRDGHVAAGFAQTATRSPALWWDDGSTLVPDPNMVGEFHAISDDGTLAAGTALAHAMYWTADEGIVNLGSLAMLGEFELTRILGVCDGGQMLIGTQAAQFGSGTALVWTQETGLRPFTDLLADYAIEVPADVVQIERAVSCSADGRRIAGTLVHTDGLKAFVVDFGPT